MDLFAAAGVDIPSSRPGARARPSSGVHTPRVPLFNHRVIEDARKRAVFIPTPDEIAAARDYTRRAASASFAKQKETSVRPLFFGQVLGRVLGYREFDPDQPYSISHEHPIRGGSADAALGRFTGADKRGEVIAPCEVKGPGAVDLEAVPPGRARSPVQQGWDYAIDAPGSRWVIVTNCVELRLYAFGRGRDAYHRFDLTKLDDREEHARLWLLLSADRLLGGATDALLRETDTAYKEITDKLYGDYKGLRDRLVSFLTGSVDGPKLAPLDAIEPAQKILDRVLFIAFAQRTGLISQPVLEQAEKTQAFIPVSKWTNFKGLFHFCNVGNFDRDIEAFNGGLFAPDPVIDRIEVPDDLVTGLAKLGEWDYRSDVPVTILGHIFEQSITDLEKLRAQSQGLPEPDVKRGKKKREGVVYTPDPVTRFLVERTMGLTLAERFAALLREHAGVDVLPKNGDAIPWRDGEASEKAFWRAYLAVLRDLTVVDPACGSGAFLVEAFDTLAREYRRVTERLAALGEPADFDPLDWIVTKNLHGVDLNAESVEITRLSLWLKTARRKHRLQNLEATIKTGDSLIGDGEYTREPFDWQGAFPDVFARGGFDLVIGNPPYVRMEFLKAVKPYLEEHYRVATDRADLYAYFFEKGVGILKPGGRLGYISSSTFFRTGSGEKLRALLSEETAIEAVIDFGDEQIFEGVTTYPAILTLRKPGRWDGVDGGHLSFLKIEGDAPKDLGAAFDAHAVTMPRARLGAGSWQFENDALARMRSKIVTGRKTLGEVYGPPLYGIKTGLNEAFVIDGAIRDRLVRTDPKSEELLKPFLRGEDVKRWRVEPEGLFLINTPRGKVDIDAYPAIRDWLLPFKPQLEGRATKQEWFELQQAQLAYQPKFSTPKISYGHFAQDRIFSFEEASYFSNDKSYFIPNASYELLSLLNSKVAWFFITGVSPAVRGGFHEMRVQYVQRVPIPLWREADRTGLATLAETATRSASERFETQAAVGRRILDLAPGRDLSRKLETWWELDFAGFLAEVKRVLKVDVPLRQRGEWESFLAENRAAVQRLTAEIETAEREIDALVYRLFDLTPDEIALLESSLEGQY